MWTIAWAATAAAWAGNIWGGEIVSAPVLHTEVGFPHVEVGARLPISGRLEVMPKARFAYARGFRLDLSTSVAVDIRIVVADVAGVHAAATLSFPFYVDPERNAEGGTDVFLGIGVGHPGFVLDYTSPAGVSFDLGVRFEDDLAFEVDKVRFAGFLPFLFGIEAPAGPTLRLGGKLEAGPTFDAQAGGSNIAFELRVLLGINVDL
jgi:hypothetical protein